MVCAKTTRDLRSQSLYSTSDSSSSLAQERIKAGADSHQLRAEIYEARRFRSVDSRKGAEVLGDLAKRAYRGSSVLTPGNPRVDSFPQGSFNTTLGKTEVAPVAEGAGAAAAALRDSLSHQDGSISLKDNELRAIEQAVRGVCRFGRYNDTSIRESLRSIPQREDGIKLIEISKTETVIGPTGNLQVRSLVPVDSLIKRHFTDHRELEMLSRLEGKQALGDAHMFIHAVRFKKGDLLKDALAHHSYKELATAYQDSSGKNLWEEVRWHWDGFIGSRWRQLEQEATALTKGAVVASRRANNQTGPKSTGPVMETKRESVGTDMASSRQQRGGGGATPEGVTSLGQGSPKQTGKVLNESPQVTPSSVLTAARNASQAAENQQPSPAQLVVPVPQGRGRELSRQENSEVASIGMPAAVVELVSLVNGSTLEDALRSSREPLKKQLSDRDDDKITEFLLQPGNKSVLLSCSDSQLMAAFKQVNPDRLKCFDDWLSNKHRTARLFPKIAASRGITADDTRRLEQVSELLHDFVREGQN